MVHSNDNAPDLFTQDFDSLIDLPHNFTSDIMAQLLLVKSPEPGPFDLDLIRQHTPDHHNCPACIAANQALQVNTADMARMIFSEAGVLWMLLRAQSAKLRPRTHETTQDYLNALGKFFGKLRLCDITPGHLRGYQIARLHNLVRCAGQEMHPWKREAGHSIINHELCMLGKMLAHCKLWHRVKPYYFPLHIPGWSPREILSETEEEELWKVASKHPEAELAYWVATITNNTTASGIELRGLRLKQIFLRGKEDSEIYIPKDAVKNSSRPRMISLNAEAIWAMGECYKRALKLGSHEPDHYLFPFRNKTNQHDPERPASRWFIRNSWDKLRAATGFTDLNPHDLRHHCITRMLENGVDPEMVIATAGHINKKMLEYYSHPRQRARYAAVLAIESKGKKKPPASEKNPAVRKRKAG